MILRFLYAIRINDTGSGGFTSVASAGHPHSHPLWGDLAGVLRAPSFPRFSMVRQHRAGVVVLTFQV